jgi:hypothetical protein
MGYTSQHNQPLIVSVVAKLMEMVLNKVEDQEERVARKYMKFGVADTQAACASLCRNKVFLLDLASLWRYINMGREGKIPQDPMKTGTDLSFVPHVIVH